ncbi:MAG: hypothetical protein OET44_20620 [Gammaproteobacteria bacterium]|nr:hypothetical protein [Gammaproteobacteria bacterium]
MSAYAETLDIHVRDVANQRPSKARGLRAELSIGDLVQRLRAKMNLPEVDATGQPHVYHAYLQREARHLHATETVGDVLQTDDEIILQPDVQAG